MKISEFDCSTTRGIGSEPLLVHMDNFVKELKLRDFVACGFWYDSNLHELNEAVRIRGETFGVKNGVEHFNGGRSVFSYAGPNGFQTPNKISVVAVYDAAKLEELDRYRFAIQSEDAVAGVLILRDIWKGDLSLF